MISGWFSAGCHTQQRLGK